MAGSVRTSVYMYVCSLISSVRMLPEIMLAFIGHGCYLGATHEQLQQLGILLPSPQYSGQWHY